MMAPPNTPPHPSTLEQALVDAASSKLISRQNVSRTNFTSIARTSPSRTHHTTMVLLTPFQRQVILQCHISNCKVSSRALASQWLEIPFPSMIPKETEKKDRFLCSLKIGSSQWQWNFHAILLLRANWATSGSSWSLISAYLNSFLAPTKLVPWSVYSTRGWTY